MKRTQEIKFIRTYSSAQWIRDIVIDNDADECLLEFFEPNEDFIKCALKPNKITLLHRFINQKIDLSFEYEASKFPDFDEWNKMTIEHLGLPLSKNKFENDEYYPYKIADIITQKILPKIADEVFYLLFSDRDFLFYFNKLISEKIKTLKKNDYPILLSENGVVKRSSYWPKWLKMAIFYRDKGLCNYCLKDVSGLLNLKNKINLDHIIPLKLGGTNDTVNIQLLCEECNKKKKAKCIKTNPVYVKYY